MGSTPTGSTDNRRARSSVVEHLVSTLWRLVRDLNTAAAPAGERRIEYGPRAQRRELTNQAPKDGHGRTRDPFEV